MRGRVQVQVGNARPVRIESGRNAGVKLAGSMWMNKDAGGRSGWKV